MKRIKYRSFRSARAFVRSLGITSTREWISYCKNWYKPNDIPASPNLIYKDKWISWMDWLGSENVNCHQEYMPFKEARAIAQRLHFKSRDEWYAYCKCGTKRKDIPANPSQTYKGEWVSWGDWLGTGYVANHKRVYLSFIDAKLFVKKLGIKTQKEWLAYSKSDKKPDNIPAAPRQVYGEKWKGWCDWLGGGTVSNQNKVFFTFKIARAFVRRLGLKSRKEWNRYSKSEFKPKGIPSSPYRSYKKDWVSWGDWLGK